MSEIGSALSFIDCFPEAQAWHFTVVDKQKEPITNAPQLSTAKLRLTLPHALGLKNVHVFIRPLLSNLIFVDLDEFTKYNKDLEEVIKLQPRALVRTSESCYQVWYTIPPHLPPKQGVWITKSLNVHFKGDERSLKPLQQGRLPGSVSVNTGKN